MSKFEVGKEYKTRNGSRAVVLSDKYPHGCYPLVGVVKSLDEKDYWHPASWMINGTFSVAPRSESAWDLMPEPREWWDRVHKSGQLVGRLKKRASELEVGPDWGPIIRVREIEEEQS